MRHHDRTSIRGQLAVGAVVAAAALASAAQGASAASYPMYQCRDALGQFSSIRTDWTVSAAPGGQLYNVCSTLGEFGIRETPSGQTGERGGTTLGLGVPASSPHVTFKRVAFKVLIAPKTGDPILSHGWVTVWSSAQELETQLLPGGTTSWISRVDVPLGGMMPGGARSVALGVSCFGNCQFSPWESLQIHQAVFSLAEGVAPVVGGVGGSLLEGGVRRGVQTFDVWRGRCGFGGAGDDGVGGWRGGGG
jgi:hypothetical protein